MALHVRVESGMNHGAFILREWGTFGCELRRRRILRGFVG
jgi:hypothetical protein